MTTSDANRWTGGTTANYAVSSPPHRLTVGADVTNDRRSGSSHRTETMARRPSRTARRPTPRATTRSTRSTISARCQPQAAHGDRLHFSFGGQGFYETEVLNGAVGKQFAGPGISTVTRGVADVRRRAIHARRADRGLAQNRFSFGDRLFTTVGVRVDGNSAFGKSYGYQTLSQDRRRLQPGQICLAAQAISSLKLRGALGTRRQDARTV